MLHVLRLEDRDHVRDGQAHVEQLLRDGTPVFGVGRRGVEQPRGFQLFEHGDEATPLCETAVVRDQPSGVVTFLFTDVEGSTRLWAAHTAVMERALARHDELLRAAIDDAHGYVFSIAGDSFGAAFAAPEAAVAAACAAQIALHREQWMGLPDGLRVRMGLHLGTTQERAGNYFGPDGEPRRPRDVGGVGRPDPLHRGGCRMRRRTHLAAGRAPPPRRRRHDHDPPGRRGRRARRLSAAAHARRRAHHASRAALDVRRPRARRHDRTAAPVRPPARHPHGTGWHGQDPSRHRDRGPGAAAPPGWHLLRRPCFRRGRRPCRGDGCPRVSRLAGREPVADRSTHGRARVTQRTRRLRQLRAPARCGRRRRGPRARIVSRSRAARHEPGAARSPR